MLWASQHARAALLIGIGFLATCAGAGVAAASNAAAAIVATSPTRDTTSPITPVPALDCVTGVGYPDFDPFPTGQINVGAFFDRLRRSTTDHFMVKYFVPPTPGRYRIEGFSLRIFASGGSDVLHAAGVIKTRADKPRFPNRDALQTLQVLRLDGRGPGIDTCVDLAPHDILLEPGDAAWLVIQFPIASHFIGVLADVNGPGNTDRGGDYLSRDSGDLWYRPDPTQSVTYDWAFTPYVSSLAQSPETWTAWTAYKQLYR